MNETGVRELLTGLAEETPSTTSVSSYRAVEQARTRQRTQRRLVIGGAAAAVVLVLVLAALAVNAVRGEQKAAPLLNHPALEGPTRFNPAETRLSLGWMPGEQAIRYRHTVDALRECVSTPRTEVCIRIRGFEPTASVPWATSTVGPYIGGGQSRWFPWGTESYGEAGELWWQYAPNSWATIMVNWMPDGRTVAERIARELKYTLPKRIPLPFSLTAEPAGQLMSTDITDTKGLYDVSVRWDGKSGQTIVRLHAAVPPSVVKPTTVAGRWPVQVTPMKRGGSQVAFAPQPDVLAQIEASKSQAVATAAAFRLVGTLDDPSTWR